MTKKPGKGGLMAISAQTHCLILFEHIWKPEDNSGHWHSPYMSPFKGKSKWRGFKKWYPEQYTTEVPEENKEDNEAGEKVKELLRIFQNRWKIQLSNTRAQEIQSRLNKKKTIFSEIMKKRAGHTWKKVWFKGS